jgi:hypothetical protein
VISQLSRSYPFIPTCISQCGMRLLMKMTSLLVKQLCITSILAVSPLLANAADVSSYGSLGTQGVGAGVSIPLTDSSALRLELNGLSVSKDFTEDSIDLACGFA